MTIGIAFVIYGSLKQNNVQTFGSIFNTIKVA